eukprot:g13680.t1
MYQYKYKRKNPGKRSNQCESEPQLFHVYINMNMDNNGDSKVSCESVGREKKLEKGRRGVKGMVMNGNCQIPMRKSKYVHFAQKHRPKSASIYRSPSSFNPYRQCLISNEKLGGACKVLSYCGQDHRTVGTGHPTYKNIHNVINSSPMFKEASIVTSHLYKRRKERNDLLKNASVGAAHDNKFWQPNAYIERPATAKERSKFNHVKISRPKSAVFRSRTRSRPSSAMHLCNFERFYELETKNNACLISERTNAKGTFHWAEAESIRLWNSKGTSNFSQMTDDRHLYEFQPVYNYKGGKIGRFRAI